MFYLKFKRFYDFFLALFGLLLLSPIYLIIIISIKIDSKGPILFKQKRVGKNKVHFNIYKFRTMRIDTPANTPTHMLENPEQWITKVGKFLRKTSLDELPQLINILKGNMSFVGPRPALWNQYDLIEERDKYGVHTLLPGITGWAQVNGRDKLLITDKAKLDGEYLKNLDLWTDIKLVIKTFIVVFKSEGVVEGGTGKIKKDESENEEKHLDN
ncbi:MAG: sugar transferase [Acholeplasma sp.]|jgi:O-antigen biosynthesis protein WbqP|nr:sugar transferase [Acholeplasma sp.]